MPSANVSIQTQSSPMASSIVQFAANNKLWGFGVELSMASSGSNNPLILIKNPVGSGKTFYLWEITAASSVANVAAIFKLFSNPTIGANGTAVIPLNRNIGGTGSSAMSVYKLPTITSAVEQLASFEYGQNSESVYYSALFSLLLLPGQNLLLTGDPLSNNRMSQLTLVWAEV
jgi:hypothetical protein